MMSSAEANRMLVPSIGTLRQCDTIKQMYACFKPFI
jgi:hypothetical protein